MEILLPVIVLGVTGLAAAVILFFIAKRFAVHEDPRIAQVEAILPGANCGACGKKGCHDFATACCCAASLDGLMCPGAGTEGMRKIACILGLAAVVSTPKKAFLLCNGTCANRTVQRVADTSVTSCRLARTLAYPEGYCSWGCLGCGDCVDACRFDAVKIDPEKGIAVFDFDNCTGCGACATACPQKIISIRAVKEAAPTAVVEGTLGPDDVVHAVWTACSNHARGAQAKKMCAAACIGCGKCVRSCPQKAITLSEFLAVIDPDKCVGCCECVAGCPTGAIHIQINHKTQNTPC